MRWNDVVPPAFPPAATVPDYLLRLRRARLRLLRGEVARLEDLAGAWARLGCADQAAESYQRYCERLAEAEALSRQLAEETMP